MRRVVLESPYGGNALRRYFNQAYARRAVRDSLSRGEAPLASHLLYTQAGILDDGKAEQRKRGIEAGLAWLNGAEASVVYVDRGITNGMTLGIKRATELCLPIEYRKLKP